MINDLATDRRVQKTCAVLVEKGYEVTLIGRVLPNSLDLPALPYRCIRMRLLFTKGPAFYFFFNLRLFFQLLSRKADVLVANDLDTLWPNYLVAKLRGCKLIYDSHEIFTEVPELQGSKTKKKIWERLERKIVPKLKHCITVNYSIAEYFENKYGVRFHVIRNIPPAMEVSRIKTRAELALPEHRKIVLLQGAGINVQRGAEELVESMQFVEGALLLIIGGGDVYPKLKDIARSKKLKDKVKFIDKIPSSELVHYTRNADLGLTLDKNTNLNYRLSLPNKIFDYVNAGIPVLASRLPEIERFILKYQIGNFIEEHTAKHIALKISETLYHPDYNKWKANTLIAAKENTWADEKKVWDEILD